MHITTERVVMSSFKQLMLSFKCIPVTSSFKLIPVLSSFKCIPFMSSFKCIPVLSSFKCIPFISSFKCIPFMSSLKCSTVHNIHNSNSSFFKPFLVWNTWGPIEHTAKASIITKPFQVQGVQDNRVFFNNFECFATFPSLAL